MPMMKSNLDKMAIEPCKSCGSHDAGFNEDGTYNGPDNCDENSHWVRRPADRFNYFLIKGQWVTLPSKFVEPMLGLIDIEMALEVAGAIFAPKPLKVGRSLTDFFSFLSRQGVTPDQLVKEFPPEQVRRMKGRVFGRLVKGK